MFLQKLQVSFLLKLNKKVINKIKYAFKTLEISAINKNSVRFKFDVKKNMTQNEKDWTKINSEKLLEKAKCNYSFKNFT